MRLKLIEIDKIQNLTDSLRETGEATVTYICRVFNDLTDEMFYSLNIETRSYLNNVVIQVVRRRKYKDE